MRIFAILCLSAVGFGLGQGLDKAHATLYDYDSGNNVFLNDNAGRITNIAYQYDDLDGGETLSMQLNMIDYDGADVDDVNGGWFVLSAGTSPTISNSELAIMYLDFTTNDIHAYSYNGLNNTSSFQDQSAYIQSFEDAIHITRNNGQLFVEIHDLDVAALQDSNNDPAWTGLSFDDEIGIWAHFGDIDIRYAQNGLLSRFSFNTQSYADFGNASTSVSEPIGLGLLGLIGLAMMRRRVK